MKIGVLMVSNISSILYSEANLQPYIICVLKEIYRLARTACHEWNKKMVAI